MIWPPSPTAISTLLAILLLILPIIRGYRPRMTDGHIFIYIFNAFATAFVVGSLLIPAAWTTASFFTRGGSIEHNLYPGASLGGLMFWTFASSLITSVIALSRFFRRPDQESSED